MVSHLETFMSHFWARFEVVNGETFRLDTRIYLKDIDIPNNNDRCIGAIVGKNPGSAKPSTLTDQLQSVVLDNDKLLPTVLNVITKAYQCVNVSLPDRGYVQVLNLFYLCNSKLDEAIASIDRVAEPPLCESETRLFPWVWYVWGDQSDQLDPRKKRFSQLNANHHFFFDKTLQEVRDGVPRCCDFARHTQGLTHDSVVPHIARLIANG